MVQAILTSSRDQLQKLAHYRKGYVPEVKFRPVLVYRAIEYGVMTDGHLLVENEQATKDVVGKYLAREQKKEVSTLLKNIPSLSQEEANRMVRERYDKLAKEGRFPDYKALYKDKLGNQAQLVGIDKNPERNYRVDAIAYLSDGEHIVPVNADKLAFVLKYLPNAKIFLAKENPKGSPLTFVENGKKKGLLMPLYVQEIPGEIKDAVSKLKVGVIAEEDQPQVETRPTVEAKGLMNWQRAQKEASERIESIENEWVAKCHVGTTKEQQSRVDTAIVEIAKKYHVPAGTLRKAVLWEATPPKPELRKRMTVEEVDEWFRSQQEFMAERTKVKPQKEPKSKKEKVATQVKSAIQTDRGIAIDRSLLARKVVPVGDPRWLRHPNRYDIRGVDTPKRRKIKGRQVSRTVSLA